MQRINDFKIPYPDGDNIESIKGMLFTKHKINFVLHPSVSNPQKWQISEYSTGFYVNGTQSTNRRKALRLLDDIFRMQTANDFRRAIAKCPRLNEDR